MTKLLNRGPLFIVLRSGRYGFDAHVVGGFSELEEADDYRGVCEQQWKEKVGDPGGVEFTVQMTTYYGK